MQTPTTAIIGSGFSGLSAAAYLSKAGHKVHVFEKHSNPGGRARMFETSDGFRFDMGPSWYWMPEVFESFFKDFETSVSLKYSLDRLDPSFSVVFNQNEIVDIPSSFDQLCELFESIEKGASEKLKLFIEDAKTKYQVAMDKLVHMPGLSISEFMDKDILLGALKLDLFSSYSSFVRKYFSDPRLIQIMEFPVLFLGAKPQKTPALYSMMNYAGLFLGTFYPQGGFISVVEAMKKVAEDNGAVFHFNSPVEKIHIQNDYATSLQVNGQKFLSDFVVCSADYAHSETLMDESYRNYSAAYWEKKVFAPSALIFYLGINKKIDGLHHHTLFFDAAFDQHAIEIYDTKQWPSKPLFYICCPSKTDPTVAPEGMENLFILMPLATNVSDTKELREEYFKIISKRFEKVYSINIQDHIVYKRSYCVNDFVKDYNACQGNAYGLSNTLFQTAIFKPSMINKKVSNIYYTGQLTVPGPGVPPSIISGKIVSDLISKYSKKNNYEAIV